MNLLTMSDDTLMALRELIELCGAEIVECRADAFLVALPSPPEACIAALEEAEFEVVRLLPLAMDSFRPFALVSEPEFTVVHVIDCGIHAEEGAA